MKRISKFGKRKCVYHFELSPDQPCSRVTENQAMSATRLLCNDRSDDGILKRRIKTNDGPVTVDLKLAVPAKAGASFQDKKPSVAAQATTLEKQKETPQEDVKKVQKRLLCNDCSDDRILNKETYCSDDRSKVCGSVCQRC